MLFSAAHQPKPPSRVVVTGIGMVTSLGLDCPSNAEGFRQGRIGTRRVTLFDVERQRVKTAAEVDLPAGLPKTNLSAALSRRLDRASRMLILAGHEAWTQAGWEEARPHPNERENANPHPNPVPQERGHVPRHSRHVLHERGIPLVLGTTSGGMAWGEDFYRVVTTPRHSCRGQPTSVIAYQAQRQALNLCEALGIDGPITLIANACASGANAIGHAWELVRHGRAQRVLTGGYDALCQLVFSGFDSLQALSPTQCRPFDTNRDGLAIGEGAAVLTLETLESARQRGARILGEIVGYAATTDLHHLTQPHPRGEAAIATMRAACVSAGIEPDRVRYVNAHGTGTQLNDVAEAEAINTWAGSHAGSVYVSSTKSSVGHLLGAAGAVETAICLLALREGWLPPTSTLQTPDPACRFPLVSRPTDLEFDYALSNSFGFGGANACLVLRRWA